MFGSWLVNPWLLGAGSLLVLSPIIIHLLNKRRFKTVDWAAMHFLVEADQRNRRRVRLEDLLLLALRCLAVLLVTLLVARPFLALGHSGGTFDSVRCERIVVLDDSPSMDARAQGSSPWQSARRRLAELVEGLAGAKSDDSLTLLLASEPSRPVFHALPINDETVAEIAERIKELEVSDLAADFDAALVEIDKSLKARSANVNHVVYLLSDLRRRDWSVGEALESEGMLGALRRISRQTVGCFVVDVAGDEVDNLAVTEIASQEKALALGVASRFEVSVKNFGAREAGRVRVTFTTGDSLPLEGRIDAIPPGATESVPFTYTFARPDAPLVDAPPEPVPIRAELAVKENPGSDRLAADNVRHFPARVTRGVPTLIVDGDPSATYGRSESFFLRRALAPPGEFLSGIDVEVASDADFETLPLDPYRVIYLANVYRLSDRRREALEAWVRSGGGLVIAPGDQVDEAFYNGDLHRDGDGPLPLKLRSIQGDEKHERWVAFAPRAANHPVLAAFEGRNNPFVAGVKVFRWWSGSISPDELRAGRAACVARLTDGEASPAIVERAFGDGRVLALATALDADWANWPESPSFLITMQELNRYVARKTGDEGSVVVGEPLRHPLDLAEYRTDASISGPGIEAAPIRTGPDPGRAAHGAGSQWLAGYDATARRGFYRMALRRTDGSTETVLFAANLDPSESDLGRVDRGLLRRALGDARVEVVDGTGRVELVTEGAKGELWRGVLAALVGLLCVEQFLGWLFGLRR